MLDDQIEGVMMICVDDGTKDIESTMSVLELLRREIKIQYSKLNSRVNHILG